MTEREERLEVPGQVTGQPCLGLYPKRPAGLGRRGPWIKIPALTLTLLVAVCFPVSPDLHCWFPVGQPDMVFLTLWLGSSDHVSAFLTWEGFVLGPGWASSILECSVLVPREAGVSFPVPL